MTELAEKTIANLEKLHYVSKVYDELKNKEHYRLTKLGYYIFKSYENAEDVTWVKTHKETIKVLHTLGWIAECFRPENMTEHYEGTKLGWINYKVMLDYTDDKNFNTIQRNKRIKDGLKKGFAGTVKTIDSIATGMAKFSQNMNPPKKKRYRYRKTREYY